MNTEELKEVISKVRFSLEGVTVQGKNNCGRLYGCLDILDQVLNELSSSNSPEKETE